MKDSFNPLSDLEKELGIDDMLAVEASELTIRMDSRRYGKSVTVISGFDRAVDVGGVAKSLKHRIGTGGTARDYTIELQGDHRAAAKKLLLEQGFRIQ